MTKNQCDKTTKRLDALHEELLRKLTELDLRVTNVLAEWGQVAEHSPTVRKTK